ncbi:hypothetical protein Tco_0384671, partial [Tanacetum coccineum]
AHQATSGQSSLGPTGEERVDPQLNRSKESAFVTFSISKTSFICHSESTSRVDASTNTIAEADLGKSVLNDSVPQQQGTDEGTKNIFIDLNFLGTFSQDPTGIPKPDGEEEGTDDNLADTKVLEKEDAAEITPA